MLEKLKKFKKSSCDVLCTILEPAEPINEIDMYLNNNKCFNKTELRSRVENILNQKVIECHPLFCELIELRHCKKSISQVEWVETARWVKYEEDVDAECKRWSKPHVATISLKALGDVRTWLKTGTVLIDLEVNNYDHLVEQLVHKMILSQNISIETAGAVISLLLSKHRHQYEGENGRELVKDKTVSRNSEKDDDSPVISATKSNVNFFKKVPSGSEAANILVGMVNFLKKPLSAFVRLKEAKLLADLTEVAIPTKFFYVMLGPDDGCRCYHEIGRAVSTLLSDDVFHCIAYKANCVSDIIIGVDEFMDQCTVLPPGEWDPEIRIDPPDKLPDPEQRKHFHENNEQVECTSGLIEDINNGKWLFSGMINDIKNRKPHFKGDFKDALNVHTLSSIFFMYFACLTPVVTFGGLLEESTHLIGITETILGISFCSFIYHIFSAQPLTIISCAGPIISFETILYHICVYLNLNFLAFRCLVGAWITILLVIVVAFNLSSIIRYITRFTEEVFSMLIAVIYIFESIHKLWQLKFTYSWINDKTHYCFCFIFLNSSRCDANMTSSYNYTVLNKVMKENVTVQIPSNTSTYAFINPPGKDANVSLQNFCRYIGGYIINKNTLSSTNVNYPDDTFFFSCLLFIATFILSIYLSNFRYTNFFGECARNFISNFGVIFSIIIVVSLDAICGFNTVKLSIPETIIPTADRSWVVDPFVLPYWAFFLALPPAMIGGILVFMDQQLSCIMVNREENQLKKGHGYHWDLFIVAVEIFIMSIFGFPWFVAETVLSLSHVGSLNIHSTCTAPGERPKFLGIREQRVSGMVVSILIGLSVFFTPILRHIPTCVLFGVFLYMGVTCMNDLQFLQRISIIFMSQKSQPDYIWLRHVPNKRVYVFTVIQITCFVILFVVKKIELISITFPLVIVGICFIRKLLDFVFSKHELTWLDDNLPETKKKKHEDITDCKINRGVLNLTEIGKFDDVLILESINHSHVESCSQNDSNDVNTGGYRLRSRLMSSREGSMRVRDRIDDYRVNMTPLLQKESIVNRSILRKRFKNEKDIIQTDNDAKVNFVVSSENQTEDINSNQ